MRAFVCVLLAGAVACTPSRRPTTASAPRADTLDGVGLGALSTPNADPFPSTYAPYPARTTVIRGVNIFTAAGPLIRNGAILLQNGKVAAIGQTVDAPADAVVIDGAGKYVTPGLVDNHSHLGVYAAPGGNALSDGNQATNPHPPPAWAEHAPSPHDTP